MDTNRMVLEGIDDIATIEDIINMYHVALSAKQEPPKKKRRRN